MNPKERDASKQKFPEVTFEMAQEEVAKKSGFDMSGENKSRGVWLAMNPLLTSEKMIVAIIAGSVYHFL